MNWKPIAGDWQHYKIAARSEWSRLTMADVDAAAGNRFALIVRIRGIYGISQQQAESQVAAWAKRATAIAPAP
jgi:hypothetical protein